MNENSKYCCVENVQGDLYFGKGAGKKILDSIHQAKKSIKIVSPYISSNFVDWLTEIQTFGINVVLITSDNQKTDSFYNVYKPDYTNIAIENKKNEQLVRRKMFLSRIYKVLLVLTIICVSLLAISFGLSWLITMENISYENIQRDFSYLLSSLTLISNVLILLIATFLVLFIVVKIVITNISGKIRYIPVPNPTYSEKLKGLKIVYSQSAFIHSKIYIIDDEIAYIGSLNFTENGINSNYESCLTIRDKKTVEKISQYVRFLFEDTSISKVNRNGLPNYFG